MAEPSLDAGALPAVAAFLQAAGEGDCVLLRELWASLQGRYATVSKIVGPDQRTALHVAAIEGKLEAVRLLVKLGAEVNARDRWQHTACDEARVAGHRSVVEYLLAHGAIGVRAYSKDDRYAAFQLCMAAGQGWLGEVQRLHEERRVDVGLTDYDKRTAIHTACYYGQSHVVDYLLLQGAQLNIVDAYGDTPLGNAVTRNHEQLAASLRAKGAMIYATADSLTAKLCTAANEGNVKVVARLVEQEGCPVDAADYDKRTALHVAASAGQLKVVEYLLGAGADINAKDRWKATPLAAAMTAGHNNVVVALKARGADAGAHADHLAARLCAAAAAGDVHQVERLVDEGAPVDSTDYSKRTALHFAASEGHKDVVALLLAKGANPNAYDRWNDTPTANALLAGHEEVAELLQSHGGQAQLPADSLTAKLCAAAGQGLLGKVKKWAHAGGADINRGDYDGRTALHLAASEGRIQVVEYLLSAGAEPNVQDRWANTPLGDALEAGHEDVAELLRKNGAHFNTKALSGIRARMCAAAATGRLGEIKKLVAEGADVNVCDYDRRSPLHLAATEGHADVVAFLLEHGADMHAADRWGNTPYSNAVSNCHSAAAGLLSQGASQGRVLDHHWRVDPQHITFIRKVAEGFQGATWLAEWNGLTVAVKKLKATRNGEALHPDTWKLFNNEIDLLSQLRHPNLVMCLGASVDVQQPLLIEEYMAGGSLQELLERNENQRRSISEAKVLRYAHDVALGLNYLHTYNPTVIHRDLTPGNLLFTRNRETVKIADFGFGKLIAPLSMDSEVYTMTGGLGSLRYMAPEVLLHQSYNETVDVYSFGIVLCYMATGQRPYGPTDPYQAAKAAALQGLRPVALALPDPLQHLCEACWRGQPSDRPTMAEVLRRLEAMQTGMGGGQKGCVLM